MKLVSTRNLIAAACFAVVVVCGAVSALAQASKPANCRGPIYARKDVATPAKLVGELDYASLNHALGRQISGRVTLDAVLCRSGQVTDIKVVDSQPQEIGEFVAAALSLVRFKPAELNWHTVSQRQQFVFEFGDGSNADAIDSKAAAGRAVEELVIIGNRRLTKEQMYQSIKTRPGELYNPDQVQKDLVALLATGNFDASGTRVILEDAMRGGVRVLFEVKELPLIAELKFAGLKEAYQSAIIGEFRRQHVEVQKGAPLDPARLKQAERVIRIFFESQGWRDVKVETLIEHLSATEVAVTFKVTAYKFGP